MSQFPAFGKESLIGSEDQLKLAHALYRGGSTHAGLGGLGTQDHFAASASRPGNAFPGQAGLNPIIGGGIGGGLTSLGGVSRLSGAQAAQDAGSAFSNLSRFPGGAGQFGSVIGQGLRTEDDFLGSGAIGTVADSDDFPALPSQLNKHDAIGSSVGHGMLGGSSILGGGMDNSSSSLFSPAIGSASLLDRTAPGTSLSSAPRAVGAPGNPLYPGGGFGSVMDSPTLSVASSLSVGSSQPSGLLAGLTGGAGASSSVSLAGLGLNKETKFGMLGLLESIKSTDRDINTLALGTDLTTFGLNLNATDSLYTSFVSPFFDANPNDNEPQYKTPQCYLMPHPPVLKADHWSKLTVETLFYIFYQMPKDILQACAAHELYRRDWKFHSELRIWLKPRPAEVPTLGAPPVTGQFIFFDAKAWEQRLFNASQYRGNLVAGFIPDEEIRVKVPLPGQSPIDTN